MKILYIHQYFRTPEEGGPIRSYYLAKGLVSRGHEVEMITAYNGVEKKVEVVDGIKVHYLPIYYDNSMSFKRRVVAFLKFMYSAVDVAAGIKGVDLCYATSTPLTVGMAAMKIKERFDIPYIFEVRDLWPEAPIQMGAIRNPWLLRYTQDLEQKIYDGAEQIVALSPGMHKGVAEKATNKPIHLIPNMSDVEFFHPEQKQSSLEQRFGTEGQFVVSYFGAIGKANHLEYLLDCAKNTLDSQLPVKYIVVGEGGERERLLEESKRRALHNVDFLPFMNKHEIRELLNVTDAAYISFANKPILETNSPNKFFDALASGKMVVTNTRGWIKDLTEKHTCGFYADPAHPEMFGDQLSTFINNENQLQAFQQNARKLGEQHFAREDQVDKLSTMIAS